ncbi:asparagine synthase (glutamine-hydrolyzing) [Dactylosporangium matsuzakiense]|uniref:asparagine synthase (glutamine-hydrolyzing) n=1 Tax=Dactylosporangium matsuzakiense TaxID=53360 RepID=A0A9W6NNR2_9ACTN|nr:asparagine synthase (glutamine-hydrolyzing) [Dactylosporangium matsuzakiense]UWZ42964.1 asparagine synthase (glutamine-hydrolyzing) [Dactylosporangium matsuzakiense]GLL03282.1 putative asparagine synthetase [glutamine-hydrolyzing] [Dactylosporangium matsuzakiense]
MCGFLMYTGNDIISAETLGAMERRLGLIEHRGPDDMALERIGPGTAAGFRRLAVIDREGSRQPLRYMDRWTLVFNGEIYNYRSLREELIAQGLTFTTDGDAEVVAAAFHAWGESALDRLRGMFAFALWDSVAETVYAARDPFGIKPLYYLVTRDGVWLSSEKAPLLDEAAPDLDPTALSLYLTMQYVPEPYTLHRDIARLPAGALLTKEAGRAPFVRRYARPTFRPDPAADEKAVVADLRAALRDSVRAHLQADVPVGAFLSSGVDSTAIVALAAAEVSPIRAFTAAFDGDPAGELEIAERSARELGVSLTPSIVRPEQVMAALPRIIWHLGDPVADPSIVPLYFLCRTAAEHVTVVLSGEGADELAGGYTIYREPQSLSLVSSRGPAIQRALRRVARAMPEGLRGKSFLERATTPLRQRYFGNARVLAESDRTRLLRGAPAVGHAHVTAALYAEVPDLDPVTTMQHIDVNTWLPGDILTKADRMSMAHSLELRVPYLDRRVFAVLSTLPPHLKVPRRGRTTKYALRQAVDGLVPPFVKDRPKLGFPTPARSWLRTDLAEWAHHILSTSGAKTLLDLDYAHGLLRAHERGEADHARKLWIVLTFCIWHSIFVEGVAPFDGSVRSMHG